MVLEIVRKELREARAFALLALGLYLVYIIRLTGQGGPFFASLFRFLNVTGRERPDIPFIEGEFMTTYVFVGIALAITLGFRQSAWEPSQGTALHLLHLPLTRRTIFLTKLATGIGLLLACTLMPILIYAAWASTPGTHAGPFEWSMTGDSFRSWLIMPLVYLGSFASGIRPARWFGSRLLPLVAIALPAVLVVAASSWWPIGFPLLCFMVALLVSDILQVVEDRDF